MRVLVVEDEAELGSALRASLIEEGYAVDLASDGEDALFRACTCAYDAVLLDLMLPAMDGWQVLAALRRERATPVLILSARDALRERIRGLDLGADDYLTKPFELAELHARLRALVRRSAASPSPVRKLGDVEIDSVARSVVKSGQPVDLSPKEYALLELLAKNPGALVSKSTIYEHLWGDDDETFSNVVEVYVAGLRRKLGRDSIRTRRGEGYVLELT